MFYTFKLIVFCAGLSATNALSSPVPLEHQSHCARWENGQCLEGALTKLAKALAAQNLDALKVRSNTCDQVCREGCPNCKHCSFCGLCSLYSDQACVGVPYFTERETCSLEQTKDCCHLCEVQCKSAEGVCSKNGFCKGGGAESDLMSYCIETTVNEECVACE